MSRACDPYACVPSAACGFGCAAALVQRQTGGLEAVLGTHTTVAQRDLMKRLQRQGMQAWWQPGHPGWRIWYDMESDAFHRLSHQQVCACACVTFVHHPPLFFSLSFLHFLCLSFSQTPCISGFEPPAVAALLACWQLIAMQFVGGPLGLLRASHLPSTLVQTSVIGRECEAVMKQDVSAWPCSGYTSAGVEDEELASGLLALTRVIAAGAQWRAAAAR
jgi:hypothetical protein